MTNQNFAMDSHSRFTRTTEAQLYKNKLKFNPPSETRECALKQSEMASLSNSRCKNRPTNNEDIAQTAKRYVACESGWREAELLINP